MLRTALMILVSALTVQVSHGQDLPKQPVQNSGEKSTLPQPVADQIFIIKYLNTMGKKLDFFFTLEDGFENRYFRAYRKKIVPDFNLTSIEEVVKFLSQELKDYRIVRSTRHPSVIHLIAKDLPKDNLLDQPVTVKYKGRLQFFVDEIGKSFKGQPKSPKGITTGNPGGDTETQIDVKLEQMTIREALTEVIPWETYNPFLWQSEVRMKDGVPDYTVIYVGRRRKPAM